MGKIEKGWELSTSDQLRFGEVGMWEYFEKDFGVEASPK